MNILERAIIFATETHAGVVRKASGTPYILHPIEVATIIYTMSRSLELAAAGALHDVVEDTPVTNEMIHEVFGDHVARLVKFCTEDKQVTLSAEVTWQQRKQATIDSLCMRAGREDKILALADKLSNLREMNRDLQSVDELEYFSRFNQKDKHAHCLYHSAILTSTAELSEFDEWQEYRELIRKVFG